MENFIQMSPRVKCCTMFCILKAVLFAVVIVFMLFVPLGDPNVACRSMDSTRHPRRAICYLCEGYFLAAKATDKAIQILHYVACVVGNLLYEGKLKFYALLESMDKRDLCSSVCCSTDELNLEESRHENRCPRCKCVRKKCHRRPRAECGYHEDL